MGGGQGSYLALPVFVFLFLGRARRYLPAGLQRFTMFRMQELEDVFKMLCCFPLPNTAVMVALHAAWHESGRKVLSWNCLHPNNSGNCSWATDVLMFLPVGGK